MTNRWIAKAVCLLSLAKTVGVLSLAWVFAAHAGSQAPTNLIYEQPEKDQQNTEQRLGVPGFHIGTYSQGVKAQTPSNLSATAANALKYIRENGSARNLNFPSYDQDFVAAIKEGQTPRTLVIADTELRTLPEILQKDSAALINLRTFGNFIPNHNGPLTDVGLMASLEYAIDVLGVRDIVIIGQANSNAIQGLYARLPKDQLNSIQRWMKLGDEAKYTVTAHAASDASKQELYNATERVSLALQLSNLLSYPNIRKKVESGEIALHGWYFNQDTGKLEYFDAESNTFRPL